MARDRKLETKGWTEIACEVRHKTERAVLIHDVFSFISALNCSNNFRRVKHHPPEKLQKARKRRGRIPCFSWYTLDIPIGIDSRAHNPGGGGTHRSPRLHKRRGHYKKRKTGTFLWRPHLAGRIELGFVEKDYAASYKTKVTAPTDNDKRPRSGVDR